ncbi:MAG: hypothetical protein KGY38_07270 [Desulfobacterales bacterium]|nr:hypothetical protein [Desulfobacterales bacterium]
MHQKPCFAATSMAFLPHRDLGKAVETIVENFPEAPCLPVLSRNIKHMLEGIPCVEFDREKKQVYLDPSPDRENEILEFYNRVENNDLDAFATSEKVAPGFYALLERLKTDPPAGLKWVAFQTAGPVLMGDILKQQDGTSAFYHETLRDILIKGVNLKSRWLEKKIREEVPGVEVIAGLPETTLVSFTSAGGTGSRENIIKAINNGFEGLSGPNWVHCCANIDWSLLTRANVDVINFDAYQHTDKVTMYHEEFRPYLERGGMLAWGIVPVTDEAVSQVTVKGLVDIIEKGIENFAEKGIDRSLLAEASWIMPCCDANLMSVENAERAFAMTREISEIMRYHYGFSDGG